MAYDDFKEGCSVIKEYADNLNKETAGKIPTKVSELTNDSNYATESYVNTAIGNIAQPSSLPQTYKKKAVTLATSGWKGVAATILDFTPEISAQGFNFDHSLGLAVGKQYQLVLRNTSTYVGTAETATDASSNQYVRVRFAVPAGGSTRYIYLCDNTLFSPYGGGSVSVSEGKSSIYYSNSSYSISGNIKVKSVDETVNNYALTDADVKVNSEVRFTLDEANGKLAGQFGVKKTIDKEAGKLTFTADTLPTSAITGTLEIGDTSTDGAAFVDGIASDIPTALPQTYKKKAVTLATSGWTASPWTDIAKNTVTFSASGYSSIGNTPYNITNTTSLAVSDTVHGYSKEPLEYKGTTSVGGNQTYMFKTADTKLSIYVGYQTQNKGEIRARSTTPGINTVTVYAQIDNVTTAYDYPLTDADVKVNSEVRLVLDEANGKLAGQFGVKKTIDKEAGKLTFTADTLPTSAISGTLEIGETSTEGAAFVDGINEDINAIEQTAAVIKFPTFLINGTKVQRVYITGRETIQPGGSKQATVNLATYGIDDAKIMMTDGNMHEYILASADTLSTDTTYFPKVRAGMGDVSGNRTLFLNIDTEPPAQEACIINYQYICLIKVEV